MFLILQALVITNQWCLAQIERFQTAWKITHSSSTMKTLRKSSAGHPSSFGKNMEWLIIAIEIVGLVLLFTAN